MSTASAFEGIPQPATYPDRDIKNLSELLLVYNVTPTGNAIMDLASTGLLYQLEMPGTDDEVLELTSGRYDGLRFSALTDTVLKGKPITREGP